MSLDHKKQKHYPAPPFPAQEQPLPGSEQKMKPVPDHGEDSYIGHGRLQGKVAVITGGDSGIGKAVAIAFAREGADVCLSYLNEQEDVRETLEHIQAAGRKGFAIEGDISKPEHCKSVIQKTVDRFGKIDILVNNAAHQQTHQSLQEISVEEWEYTFRINLHSMFFMCREAEDYFSPGSSVINTSSVNAYKPNPTLLPYAITKGAIQHFTSALAQLWAENGIRVNSVAPGPVWTPLIPASFDADRTKNFGKQSPMKRPAQPAEIAPVYVMLASDESSYVSGATVAVTGGMPTI